VIDLDRSAWSHSKGIKPSNATVPDEGRFRYCVPLAAGSEFLGFMALNERMTKEPLSLEDFDLLKTLADQTAGMILNLKLIDRLGQARELEAFQTVSAFFVHDLKNVASTLSLMLQNLPAHYDNPEFRQDALRIMSASVKKIQDMCGRLSLLKDRIELQQRECDLSELVSNTLAGLNGSLQALLVQDLRPVPKLRLDPEQMQKVLVNLILNAGDALPNGGEIRLSTSQEGDKVAIAVTDNGCGMSREFLEKSLFHPFKTTKDHGSGIGLFQSKMIVEAHRGWIEVESREGQGSTFRVVLPLEQ
jgi:putative PEP-CTERM system histidine kinase